MKFKLVLSVTCLLFFSSLNAQIMYNDEEIKKKYDQETIMLTMDGTEKNGVLSRSNWAFPSQRLQEEIDKNGGIEAQKTYKEYKKTILFYWIATILGFAILLLLPNLLFTSAANIYSVFLVAMLIAIGIGLVIGLLGKKAFRQLTLSIWQHNRHVILRK